MTKTRLLHYLKNRNVRVAAYLIILFVIAFYFILFIDSVRFFNLKKTILSFKDKVELADFEQVINLISPDNGFHAKLDLINGKPYLVLEGFNKELLTEENSHILKRKVLHPTLNMSLFSMGYASDFLLTNYKNGNLGNREVNILEGVYLFVYKEIINPFSLNRITVFDHDVSERIQFIILFSTYIKKYYPEKKLLLNALSKDFNICLGFLLDEKFFTWRTNHGIMQLRSIAQTASVIKNEKIKEALLDIFDKRLMDIIPYFIGPDGAIYEGATGYWIYIYKQFKKITEIKAANHLKSIAYLKEQLPKLYHFIHTVAANDGFLQGLGDGYSAYIPDTINDMIIPQNRYFNFSNEIVGANWSFDKRNYNLLFISLNTPPNVHKLPEDLAVYFYVNQPVFSNTGYFSGDESKERLFFKTENSQSTVGLRNQVFEGPISSRLCLNGFKPYEKNLTVTGEKQYQDGSKIIRRLEIDPDRKIYIRDSTNNSDSLIAYFNINPRININRINNKQILLQTVDSIDFFIISNCNIDITDGIISEKMEKITPIKRLKMTGNTIETTIVFPGINLNQAMSIVTNNTKENNRLFYAKKLELEYGNQQRANNNLRELVIKKSIILAFSLIILISISELLILTIKKNNK